MIQTSTVILIITDILIPYDYDRIRLIDEYYLRVSIFDSENDQTLWTGLTRWRQNSKFEPSNDISAQNLVDLILDSI